MPGKVNPVIPEVVNQIAFQVMGMDLTVTLAAEAGQLQLNAMEPVMAFNLFTMLETLKRGCRVLRKKCVDGITANPEICRDHVLNSISIVTALSPALGYEKTCAIAKEAAACGARVRDLVLAQGLMPEDELDRLLGLEGIM